MTSMVLDPFLLTTPSVSAQSQTVISWLHALQAWALAIDGSPYDWRHVLSCTIRLYELDRIPSLIALRRIQQREGVDINVGRVSRAIAAFLQDDERDLTIHLRVRDVLPKESVVRPQEVLDRNLPELRDEILKHLLCLACESHLSSDVHAGSHWVTLPFSESEQEMHVQATVEVALPEEFEPRLVNQSIDVTFGCMFTPDDLADVVDPSEILSHNEEAFQAAVERIARKRFGRAHRRLSFARQFFESLKAPAFQADPVAVERFVRICAALVAAEERALDRPPYEVRANEAASAPGVRRARDGAKLMRTRITKKRVGWRLQYWHVLSSTHGDPELVELEDVRPHREGVE